MNREALSKIYKQNLEESIISLLAERKDLSLREAMDVYYHSRLAAQIEEELCGIENMGAKYLVDDLIENEPELFEK